MFETQLFRHERRSDASISCSASSEEHEVDGHVAAIAQADVDDDASVQTLVRALVDKRLAHCASEMEALQELVHDEQEEMQSHRRALRVLEAEKKRLNDDLGLKTRSVLARTQMKEQVSEEVRQIADQNEIDRRKLSLYKMQSQQERCDTSMLLQEMQTERVKLEGAMKACELAREDARYLQAAKADLAHAIG